MNLNLAPEHQEFQSYAKAFFDRHLTDEIRRATSNYAGVWAPFETAMEWQRILDANDRAVPTWPVEYGGCDWDIVQHYLWETEATRAGAPRIPAMGLRMCAPVLMAYGTPAQKERFIPRIKSGEDFWCQGYSEPQAGSDLAALKCQAVRDGDDYIVSGTKIWTTYAQYANWIFCLVRTDTGGKPQEGISFLLIEMDTPGITITPIISISGDHEVNQVFFDEVRVPVTNLVGEENKGWTVAKYLLQHERGGAANAPALFALIQEIKVIAGVETGTTGRLIEDPSFASKISLLEMDVHAMDMMEQRVVSSLSASAPTGAAPSMLKLAASELQQKIDLLMCEAIGHYAHPDYYEARENPALNDYPGPDYAIPAMGQYLNDRAKTIYGGSSEVQRNIMAKVLFNL
ncbi:MAG: acyl-CoA dehydrogenase family protein [Pseudomonadota bacterium]